MGKPRRHSYDHLLAFALDSAWAVTPSMLTVIAGVLSRRLAGPDDETTTPFEHQARTRPSVESALGKGVALIPVHGVIAPRMNLLSEFSGGETFEGLGSLLQEALANPQVGSIVLDVDSPGGSASGASVFARQVLAGRALKPIIAQAQYAMCSAAYWFGACASEIVAAPQSQLGSIGVYCIHNDLSAALAEMGIKRTYIKQGKYKAEGNETEPLSDETRARLQAMVDKTYDAFVADIALGRTVSAAAVRSGFGQGAIVDADDALALGMVDRIATLDETLTRLTTARSTAPVLTRATSDTPQEPSPATGQDRRVTKRQERQALERAFYELGLPSGA